MHPSDVEVSKFKWFIDDIEITDKRKTYNDSITITLDTPSEPNGGGKAIGRLKFDPKEERDHDCIVRCELDHPLIIHPMLKQVVSVKVATNKPEWDCILILNEDGTTGTNHSELVKKIIVKRQKEYIELFLSAKGRF